MLPWQLLESGLIDNAHQRGKELQAGLSRLTEKFDLISSSRGKGLMVAIDIFDTYGRFNPKLRDNIVDAAFYRGLLLLGCGKAAIRFCPPLIITSEQIQVALKILTGVVEEVR